MRRKPRAKRYRKRLLLHFGKDEPQHPGVTGNISIGGISIMSAVPIPKGLKVVMRFQMPDEAPPLTMTGIVRWARRVQLQIGMAPQSRMGVMFDELPPQAYLDLLAQIEQRLGESGRPVSAAGEQEEDIDIGEDSDSTVDDTITDRPPTAADMAEAGGRPAGLGRIGDTIPNVQARRAPLVSQTQLPTGTPGSGHRLERMPETLPPGVVKSMSGPDPGSGGTPQPSAALAAAAAAAAAASASAGTVATGAGAATLPTSPGFPAPPIGATARMTTVVDEQHLAFPDSGGSPLAPTAAIDIFMQVAGKLMVNHAPPTSRLLMHRCSLAVSHTLPVTEGSALVTTVKLVQVDAPKRQLHLEAMIFDEEMQVGLGKYVVILLAPE